MKIAPTPFALLAAASSVLGLTIAAGQQAAPTAVYTIEQAAAGRTAYQASCAGCHLPDMSGRNEAAPSAGPNFLNAWRDQTTLDLYEYISTTMPPGGAKLAAETYVAITAFILQANGATAGSERLTPATAMAIGSGASGARSAVPDAGPGASPGVPAAPTRIAEARGLAITGEVKNLRPITDDMLRNPPAGDWSMLRRNYQAWSHSPLTDITTGNVKDLRLAWVWAMNETGANQTTPIVHDGVMYLANPLNMIQALDAATGELIWEHHVAPRPHRLRLDAQPGHLWRQAVFRDHRRAIGRARGSHRQVGPEDA